MNQLDVYYRALLNYRRLTTSDNDCNSLRAAIAESNVEQDKIVITRAFCTIDEDWVNAIEKGLVHIEKAIKEDRQFIRSNGEVVPIEKVKHVSKESVEHLAKHSNLITRYTEGEDIIPDKLYTVERLNEYAIYENRFLYMLLCYLRDFVTLRYNDILDLTNKYEATVDFSKQISVGKRKMNYSLSMHDVRRDDKYIKENNPARKIIDRIDLILKSILAFLATPLMEDVSKAPMIKPPITKTNVLKMNNNFKGAVALYDYIVSYDKRGYTIEPSITTLAPFKDDLADEIAEAGELVSFLAYEYGLGIKQVLKESYQQEEERLKELQIKERAEQIAQLKRRLAKSEIKIEDYVLMLEKQNRALEGESARAQALAAEITEHKEIEARLSEENLQLNQKNEELVLEIENQANRHYEEMTALKQAHEDEVHELIIKQENEIRELKAQHSEAIKNLRDAIEEAEQKHSQQLAEIKENAEKEISEARAECDENIKRITVSLDERNSTISRMSREYDELCEKKLMADARIKALGGIDADYTDKDNFDVLEREYNAFKKIYKEQWNKTKKAIRKKHLNIENIKGSREQDNDSN